VQQRAVERVPETQPPTARRADNRTAPRPLSNRVNRRRRQIGRGHGRVRTADYLRKQPVGLGDEEVPGLLTYHHDRAAPVRGGR
jgi:hypothetical protein